MGRLTTHVLDTSLGRPAAGLRIQCVRLDGPNPGVTVADAVTNQDGRCDRPLLEGRALIAGVYELRFDAGGYFDRHRIAQDAPQPRFLDQIPVRFGIADADAHYHVPLLLSPYGYSTYRGS